MNSKILYVVGGRSFSSSHPGRKISEVMAVWQRLNIKVNVCFGKDLINKNNLSHNNYGNQSHFNSSYRNKSYLQFFIHSVSEVRDILHNRKLFKKIDTEYDLQDLIWERSSRLHWAGLKLANKKKIPFVLEWKDHLVDYRFSLFKVYANYIENKKLREADFIVVESKVLKDQLSNMGINPAKIRIALNAVNPAEFVRIPEKGKEFREKIGIPHKNIVVGYLGSYAFYHNTEILIETAQKVLGQTNDVSFLLVGNGKDFEICKEKAQYYEILNNGLVMLDVVPKEDVPNILSAIDITVLPGSTYIICPIKIMEYMAAETAVLAPDYECNREVITNNKNGSLFTPGNVNELTEKIMDLKFNNEKRILLALKARDFVKTELTWEQTWGKVLIDILNDKMHN
jgi:glycosyltransferase involved in cell wall biosynthesis